jgi:uncharacterized protein YcbX
MHVHSLHIYPIKSAHGIDLNQVDIHARGLAHDRRYMIVDAGGTFLTQREIPKLAQLSVGLIDDGLALAAPSMESFKIHFGTQCERQNVRVWRSHVNALKGGEAINEALSKWLGRDVSLVFMDETAERISNPKWTHGDSPVSFADGYPILVTTTGSLNAVNAQITKDGGEPVGMRRFRPNIVIDTDKAWVEDGWKQIQIGDVVLDLVKPCARCLITSIDQETGEKYPNFPLRALKKLHPSTDPNNPGVLFGVNAVPRVLSKINTHDEIHILN